MLFQRNWVFDASNSGVASFEMGGGHIHMDSTVGGGSMKQEDEWGRILREVVKGREYTWAKEKMRGVYLRE